MEFWIYDNINLNEHKHITYANLYIPPRDAASLDFTTLDAYKLYHIADSQHYILTCDLKEHSYTDDHRGTLISNIINNSNHITLNTDTPVIDYHTSTYIITWYIESVISTLYNTSWSTKHSLCSDHLLIFTTLTTTATYKLHNQMMIFIKESAFKHEKTHIILQWVYNICSYFFQLSCLRAMYVIHDQTLVWIRSYLFDRLRRVDIKVFRGIISFFLYLLKWHRHIYI